MKREDNLRRTLRGGLLALTLAACAVAGPAAARGEENGSRTIDRTGSAPANGRVSIELLAGSLQVQGWDREEVQVTGTLDGQAEGLYFDPGKHTRIEVDYPRRVGNVDGSQLVVHLPFGCRLEIDCVSADIGIGGVRGEVEVSNTEGDITVIGPCRALEVEVVDGDVTATELQGEVEIDCTSGVIRLAGGRGSVDVECVQGDVEVDFEVLEELAIESVSGDTRVSADLAAGGDFEINAFSGRVTLTVPTSISARFRATTFSGEIRTDFGYKGEKRDNFTPGQKSEFSLGDGAADVELTAFSGDLEILKR